jgi:hypothetical protein
VFQGQPALTADNDRAIDFDRWTQGSYRRTTLEEIRAAAAFDVGKAAPRFESATDAYERILRSAGASRRRDAADERLVQGVRDTTHRMINSQDEVGGWPRLASEPALKDTDQDGMPDDWERAQGLDEADPADRNGDRENDGYTNLEEYLNSLCTPATSN